MRNAFPIIIITLLLGCVTSAWAIKQTTLDKRIIRSAESFENVVQSELGKIPPQVLGSAQGILIFRQFEVGLGFGGKGGFGVALARQRDGRWGPPAFVKSGDGSIGFQIGAHRLDIVFLFMDRSAMKMFEKGSFRVGVDAAAAAGPVGGEAQGKVGAPILIYSSSAGLYIGAKFEGGMLLPDNEANEVLYNRGGITVPQIINGDVPTPSVARSLTDVLERYTEPAGGTKRNWWEPSRPNRENSYQTPRGDGRL